MAAYECQNFKDGQVLTAGCLNKIEKALQDICNKEITSVSINEKNELVVAFCDGTQLTAGDISGADGKSVVSATIELVE